MPTIESESCEQIELEKTIQNVWSTLQQHEESCIVHLYHDFGENPATYSFGIRVEN